VASESVVVESGPTPLFAAKESRAATSTGRGPNGGGEHLDRQKSGRQGAIPPEKGS